MTLSLKDTPIRRKLIVIILGTSLVAMLLMRGAFFVCEYVAFRRAQVRQLSTLAEVLAANSTASLAFDNPADATEILSALHAERHIATAGLYRSDARLFARYPADLPAAELPAHPAADGTFDAGARLAIFHPVVQHHTRLGTLYLALDYSPLIRAWLWNSLLLGAAMIGGVLAVAYWLSHLLQKQVSGPLLALTATAEHVSARQDFSTRATKAGADEIGRLTDAFNAMLARIEQRDAALRASEARFRPLFDRNPNPMWAYDPATLAFVEVNEAAIRKYGYTRAEFLHLTVADLRADAPPAPALPAPAPPDPPAAEEHHRLRDGRIIDVEPVSHVLELAGRQVVLVVLHDITDRQRAQAEIHRLNTTLEARVAERTAQLEATNRELEAFSYSVSHDLRAPLRHIGGYAAMLTKHAADALDEKGRRYLEVISDAAHKMSRLVDDLLAFSRMNRVQLAPGEIDHDLFVAGVLREAGLDRDPRIAWSIAPLPRVRADPALLQQVWVNLLDNAAKYSAHAAAPRVEIGSTFDAARQEHVFFVRDNGVGFDMKYVDKLFGVFQRLHTESEFAGIGIGLANVRRIVARHGGRTWAEGRPGQGATFYFSLPATPNAATAAPFAI